MSKVTTFPFPQPVMTYDYSAPVKLFSATSTETLENADIKDPLPMKVEIFKKQTGHTLSSTNISD